MEEIKWFSFRYGNKDGTMCWYRLDNETELNVGVDVYDPNTKQQMQIRCEPMPEIEENLRKIFKLYEVNQWHNFYDIEVCQCDGDGWVFHMYGKGKTEIHAMGHSRYPKYFWEVKSALDQLFCDVEIKYKKDI